MRSCPAVIVKGYDFPLPSLVPGFDFRLHEGSIETALLPTLLLNIAKNTTQTSKTKRELSAGPELGTGRCGRGADL